MNEIFIGIDLAWGSKNFSGFSVLEKSSSKKLTILETKILLSLDEIVSHIQKYKNEKIYIGIDAPLVIPNENGNREIEKNFNREFAKYKISMLPVNRQIMSKYSETIRSEVLYKKLTQLGFIRDLSSNRVVLEVYPHSTIAVCFHNFTTLAYKRKKGRDVEFIKKQLFIYKNYLQEVVEINPIFNEEISKLKGQKIKDYEDKLDAITCAYSIYYSKYNSSKIYTLEGVDTFVTPFKKEK